MEKNQQITGLFLMSILLLAYMWFFSPKPEDLPQGEKITTESVTPSKSEAVKSKTQTLENEVSQQPDSLLQLKYGIFATALKGTEQLTTLENTDVKVTFSSKGGSVQKVLLKNYVTNEKEELILLDKESSFIQEIINTSAGTFDVNQLFYTPKIDGKKLTFEAFDNSGNVIVRKTYELAQSGFITNYNIELLGVVKNTASEELIQFKWINFTKKLERDLEQSRIRSTVNFYMVEEGIDYPSETSKDLEEMTAEQPVKWLSMKQKFFNSAIITDQVFNNVWVSTEVDEGDTSVVKIMQASLKIPTELGSTSAANLRYYFGPNDYYKCKEVTEGFEQNVYLGWSFFGMLNRWTTMPFFTFLENYFLNYGIIILVLVFVVKSALFPLTYRSYVSMAKMKVLKPEIDEIKEAAGDDSMKVQQETMNLYRQVGVSPLSGCIPMLAQMPVFLALYNFFPNAIQLRQKSFLWATDLSSYDSIYNLPFTIPFYGDHVSLFTLLMAGSTIVYTYFNNQMSSATMQGPMKNIGYITPLMFMFFLNSFAAGLTYYYFISNLITISQQLIIRRFVDEDKIRNVLMKNKKKNANKKKSSFQQRLEGAMKQNQEKKATTTGNGKAVVKDTKNYKNEVEGKITMLGNNGRAQVEVEITNNSDQNLSVEYEIPSGNKKVMVAAGKIKKQRFQLKDVVEKDLKIDIINAIAKY